MAKLVVNELLMYVISKLDVDNVMDIKNVITTLYDEDPVNDAKASVWSAYTDTRDMPVNRRSKVKTIDDIVEEVQQISAAYPDKDTLPVVCVALCTKKCHLFVIRCLLPDTVLWRVDLLHSKCK